MPNRKGRFMETTKPRRGCLYRIGRCGCFTTLVLALLFAGAFLGAFAPQLYNRFSLYPRQAAIWKAHAANREPVSLKTEWTEYRGVMHSHSHISHDSEVLFPEIVEALHKAKCQFIFMTDHFVDGKADYSLGWKGIHDGILFVRGFEMQAGFMPWGLPDDTVFSRYDDPAELARRIRELGGVLALGHTEAPRPWTIPEIDAMEIYNIHTDINFNMVVKNSRIETLKDLIINFRAYPEQTFRGLFDTWVLNMLVQKWDEQNMHRKITGIAANDCHQNVGIQAFYTAQDTVILLDTGHNDPERKIREFRLNFLTRALLRLIFGPLKPDTRIFRFDPDPYERTARFVNTHLLARELSEPALLDAIREGRGFIAFNMIGDAEGFAFVAEDGVRQVTMGGRIALSPDLRFRAESPLPCRFALVHDGKTIAAEEGRTFEYEVEVPGKYRIEAALPMPGEIVYSGNRTARNMAPWVVTNPIEVIAQEW